LAEAGQAIVWVIPWRRWGDSFQSVHPPEWEPDWSLPWSALVEQTRRDANTALSSPGVPHDADVMLRWMDENDM
jgi:hypothetical protein